jgi:cell division protein FtsW
MAASQDLNGPPGKLLSFLLAVVSCFAGAAAGLRPGDAGAVCLGGDVFHRRGADAADRDHGRGWSASAGWLFAYKAPSISPAGSTGSCRRTIDPRTQIGYATNAIQEGGFFGVGVGEGQVKWTLPDAHTDFIIAVAAEEYGLILVLIIMALYMRHRRAVAVAASDARARSLHPAGGLGLACIFGVQAMINMGVAVRCCPPRA